MEIITNLTTKIIKTTVIVAICAAATYYVATRDGDNYELATRDCKLVSEEVMDNDEDLPLYKPDQASPIECEMVRKNLPTIVVTGPDGSQLVIYKPQSERMVEVVDEEGDVIIAEKFVRKNAMVRVVRDMRAEFGFKKFTEANRQMIRVRVGEHMREVLRMRPQHIASLADRVTLLYFVPNTTDIENAKIFDTTCVKQQFVDYSWTAANWFGMRFRRATSSEVA